MVSSKRTGGAIDGFMEGRQQGREQGTPHAQRDMLGISPAICRREGVARIYFFPNQIFFLNWSIEMKGHVAVMQSRKIQKQRDKGYKRINKFNSNKASRATTGEGHCCSRGCPGASSIRGIKQRFGYANHATIYDFAECLGGNKGYNRIDKRATSKSTKSTVIEQSNNRRGTLLLARLLSSTLVSSTRTRPHSRVQALCGLPGVLPGCFISPRDDRTDPRVSKAIDVLNGKNFTA